MQISKLILPQTVKSTFYADWKPQLCTPSHAFGAIDTLQLRAESNRAVPPLFSVQSPLVSERRSTDFLNFYLRHLVGTWLLLGSFVVSHPPVHICRHLVLVPQHVRRQLVSRGVSGDHRRGAPSAPRYTCS